MMKAPEIKKKYETPIILDLGAITKGSGRCAPGADNTRGKCITGGEPNPCKVGSGDLP
jgi:hypothetical protein